NGQEKDWQTAQPGRSLHTCRHELQGGRFGVLELWVDATPAVAHEFGADPEQRPASLLEDKRMFEIVSDLLLEGWLKAATQWEKKQRSQSPGTKSEAVKN